MSAVAGQCCINRFWKTDFGKADLGKKNVFGKKLFWKNPYVLHFFSHIVQSALSIDNTASRGRSHIVQYSIERQKTHRAIVRNANTTSKGQKPHRAIQHREAECYMYINNDLGNRFRKQFLVKIC